MYMYMYVQEKGVHVHNIIYVLKLFIEVENFVELHVYS